jgi:hypothetical protein
MKLLLPVLSFILPAFAQTSPAAPNAGVATPWDTAPMVAALATQAARLKPILDQLTPKEWVAKGAPDAYLAQWKGAEDELVFLRDSATALEKQPEKLTLALDTYFRLQSLELRLNSLVEGVRNYQNPAVGDLLVGVAAENSANRDKLRQYITDLAASKEQEFEVADKEAQRCRGVLTKQTPAKAPAPKKKTTP